mgnify:CR=1 FL=1
MFGWRAKIGFISPNPGGLPGSLLEMERIAPEGVAFLPRFIDGPKSLLTPDLLAIYDQIEPLAKSLVKKAELDIILMAGAPLVLANGPDRIANLLTQATGLPATTNVHGLVNGMRRLDMQKIVVVTPYYPEQTVGLVKSYLTDQGFEKVALPEVRLFGGGHVIGTSAGIGTGNVEFVMEYLATEGIPTISWDVGGTQARAIRFYPTTGRSQRRLIGDGRISDIVRVEASFADQLRHTAIGGDVEQISLEKNLVSRLVQGLRQCGKKLGAALQQGARLGDSGRAIHGSFRPNRGSDKMASALLGEKTRSAASRQGNQHHSVCSSGCKRTVVVADTVNPNTRSVLRVTPGP